MLTENNLSILLMILFSICAILMLIWAKKIVKEDNKSKEANPLNDKYFFEVWEEDKPHYVTD